MRMGNGPRESGLSAKAIKKGIEESRQRLQTNYLDIYYLHAPDYADDWRDLFQNQNASRGFSSSNILLTVFCPMKYTRLPSGSSNSISCSSVQGAWR